MSLKNVATKTKSNERMIVDNKVTKALLIAKNIKIGTTTAFIIRATSRLEKLKKTTNLVFNIFTQILSKYCHLTFIRKHLTYVL